MGAIYGSSYYTIVDGPAWTTAESNAIALGGNLASISDRSENTFILDNLGKTIRGSSRGGYWIGLNADLDGNFSWSNSDPYSYNNFSAGQGLITDYRPYLGNNSAVDGQYIHVLGPYLREVGFIGESAGEWNDFPNNPTSDIRWGAQYELNKGIAEIPLSYFSILDTTFREGKGGDITITRTGGTTTSQILKIVSSDGSATLSDNDYAQISKTVTFTAGETSKTINISTTADLNVESDESFLLTMTAEGSDDVPPQITDGSATVTIKADDFKRGNSLYTIVDGPTWNIAQNNAKSIGGDLVTVNDSAENTWIVEKYRFEYTSLGDRFKWIGFTDEVSEGSWEWISGEKSNFNNWSGPQPDNNFDGTSPTGQDYAAIQWYGGAFEGDWDDKSELSQHFSADGIAEILLTPSPTYSLANSTTLIDEATSPVASVRTTISTTGVDANTRLYYTVSGKNVDANDFSFGDIQGSRLIKSDGTATFLHTAAADSSTEGTESFTIKLYTDWTRTNLVGSSNSVSISDTSQTPKKPSYSLSVSPSKIDEGDSLRASISTQNVNKGTKLYYSIKGDINADDFNDKSLLTGNVTIDSSGNASFTKKTLADKLTEGSETARVVLYSDQQRTLQVGDAASASISDTSKSPKKPSYSLSVSPSKIDEGDSLRASISTQNVNKGTKLYYSIKGDINADDFNDKSLLTGTVTINASGNASFTKKTLADKLTEGSETVRVVLYSDQQRTLQVGDAASASISDTSKSPKKPSYSLSVSPSKIDEGDSLRASISTQNVNKGTKLYYSIKGDINADDFNDKSLLTGNVTIDSSGNASFTKKTLADKLTEGSETARVVLYSDQQRTLQVGDAASASISDTSKTPSKAAYSIAFSSMEVQEGDILTSTIATKNLDPGTRLYWNISGTGVNKSDFSSGSLKGSSAIDKSGEFTLTHALTEDKTTEGKEQLTFKLFSDSGNKTLLTQKKLDIVDNSTTQQKASLRSASVNANTLNLFFDSSLDNTKPNHNRFAITADGISIDISSSTLNAEAGTLKFKLASAIKPNQTVKLAYNDLNGNQSSGVLQNPNGTDLASFSTPVSNNSADSSAPTVRSATINGKVLSLSFDEVIAKTTPSNQSWTLKEDGKAISIASTSIDSNSAQLDLTLSTAVDRGSNITLSYSDISGDQKANVIQDLAGNDLASFSNLSVENQTKRSSDPLDLNTAEINGTEIVLAFNRELSSTTPSKGTFRLKANNKNIKVQSITLAPNDREAVLKIASPVAHGDNVTLSYTDAQGNQKSNVIEDVDGNDLATISNFNLTNNTRKSATDLEVDYADADGKIINLYLTDSLSTSIPKAARFRVTADERKQKISSVSTSPSDGIITLNLEKSIKPKQDVLISYRDLKGDQRSNIAEDTDGNDLASFKNLSAINDTSTFDEITDNNPPILADAYLDGTELILEFDKTLQTGTVRPSRFKLRAGKKRIRVASALVPQDDNSTAIVTLKNPLAASANSLTLSYKDLRGDQSSLIIQDTDGNDLPSLSNFQVEFISGGNNNLPDLA